MINDNLFLNIDNTFGNTTPNTQRKWKNKNLTFSIAIYDVFTIKHLKWACRRFFPKFTNFHISEAYFLKKLSLKVVGSEANKGWWAIEVENLNTLTANLEKLYQKSIAGEKQGRSHVLIRQNEPSAGDFFDVY